MRTVAHPTCVSMKETLDASLGGFRETQRTMRAEAFRAAVSSSEEGMSGRLSSPTRQSMRTSPETLSMRNIFATPSQSLPDVSTYTLGWKLWDSCLWTRETSVFSR